MSARPSISILEAIDDPNVIGDSISAAQRAALKALYGLPPEGEEQAIASRLASRSLVPGREYSEAALICGRRSGKSDKLAANIAICEAMRPFGLKLKEQPFTQQSKADSYGTLRTLIVDRRIELPDHAELLKELRGLELELLPDGAARIGHASRAGAHDDYADVVALLASKLDRHRVPGSCASGYEWI